MFVCQIADRISPEGDGWKAAMTTLGAERHALSRGWKKRKSSDEILGGKPFAEVLRMAQQRGLTGDDRVRQVLTAAFTADRILTWTAQGLVIGLGRASRLDQKVRLPRSQKR